MGTIEPIHSVKVKHPVTVTFVRGPVHLLQAEVTWLPDINLFTSERDRLIYAYVREDLVYYYDLQLSAKLSMVYDKAKGFFRSNPINVIGEVAPKA